MRRTKLLALKNLICFDEQFSDEQSNRHAAGHETNNNNQRWGIIFITRFPKSHLPRLRHFPLSPTIFASNLQSNCNSSVYSWYIRNAISIENTSFLQNFNELFHATISFFLRLYDNLSSTYILFLFITYLFNNHIATRRWLKKFIQRGSFPFIFS